jgi:lysophospholipase L1-like esterase
MIRFPRLCIACVCLFFGSLLAAMADTASAAPEKASISFRIGVAQWRSDQRFAELMAMFERHKGVTDQVTFFTAFVHSPTPMDEVRRRAEILARRMVEVRKLGYRTGVNILCTIGHHEENLPHTLGDEYPPLVAADGTICRGTRCPNTDKMREYIRELYQTIAKTDPDYIWIDDDVRLSGHKPVYEGCFCDRCLEIFAKESGKPWTRATLHAALFSSPESEMTATRKAWLQHNRNTIARLFELIEKTVHEVKADMPLGFMTGDRFYEGYDFDRWAEVLAGPKHADVWWRPGGGFYSDEATNGLAQKAHAIGRQVSILPPSVVTIQSEIENFPYQRLKKAAHIVSLEASAHIAAGCTGAAFNVLWGHDESVAEFDPLVAHLHARRPFFDLMAKHLGRKPLVGVAAAWNKEAAASSPAGGWWQIPSLLNGSLLSMFEIGLPAAFRAEAAPVAILSGDMVRAFSDDELRAVLSKGVYIDAAALGLLNGRGFGDLTGFEFERAVNVDAIEKLVEHPLNGSFVGSERDCRQSFWFETAHVLKSRDPKAQTLAKIVDYAGAETGACVSGVFENRLGGRVCVAGYYPWTFLHSLAKSSQMKAIMRWLSKDHLPGYIASFHKMSLYIREPDAGQVALAFSNDSFDPAENVVLMLQTDQSRIRVFDMNCKETIVEASGTDGPYRRFIIPKVEPWEMRLVVTAGDKTEVVAAAGGVPCPRSRATRSETTKPAKPQAWTCSDAAKHTHGEVADMTPTRCWASPKCHPIALTSPMTIVALGDSTTAPRGPLVVYADLLRKELPQRGVPAKIINAGVPSNTTADGRARFERDVLAHQPDLVIIQFGINDSTINVWANPPESEPRIALKDYSQNLRFFIEKLRARGAKVTLMTPNPMRWTAELKKLYGKPPYDPTDADGFNRTLRPYAEEVRRIAREEKVPLVDVFLAFEEEGRKPGGSIDALLLDGMHPNEKGHRLAADRLIERIVPGKEK